MPIGRNVDLTFTNPSRDPARMPPQGGGLQAVSKENRGKRAPKIEYWNALLAGSDVRSPRRRPREQRYTRDQAAEKLATFQRGSMLRSGIMLSCYCTGSRFAPTELSHGAEAREEAVREALIAIGIPAEVIRFNPPQLPVPSMLTADDLQDAQGKDFREQAEKYNDEALENYRDSLERIVQWAKENIRDGSAAVHQAMQDAADPARKASARFGSRPKKIDIEYPDAPTRKQMFKDTDMNGNGILSLAELDLAVKTKWPEFDHKRAVIRAYKLADKKGNRDGWLTRDDDETVCEWSHFLKYLSLYTYYLSEFDSLDLNHDLCVDINEWRAHANDVFKLEGDDALTMEELDVVFSEMDADGSGRVRYDEFCIWAAKVHGDSDLGSKQALISPRSSRRAPLSASPKRQNSALWQPSKMRTFHRVRHQEGWSESPPRFNT